MAHHLRGRVGNLLKTCIYMYLPRVVNSQSSTAITSLGLPPAFSNNKKRGSLESELRPSSPVQLVVGMVLSFPSKRVYTLTVLHQIWTSTSSAFHSSALNKQAPSSFNTESASQSKSFQTSVRGRPHSGVVGRDEHWDRPYV